MKIEEVVKQAVSRAGVIKVRNAMNPTLWACLIVPAVSWTAAFVLRDTAAFLPLIVIGALPVGMWFLQTAYFSISDPGRLQSEEYQLRHQALNMIEKRGEVTDPSELRDLTATQFEMLERDESDRKGGDDA